MKREDSARKMELMRETESAKGETSMEKKESAKGRLLSEAVGGIDDRYIEEAEQFGVIGRRRRFWKRTAILAAAACLLAVLALGAGRMLSPDGGVVHAYAYGTGERLTKAGAVLHTGSVTEDGEQKGHPLMFYLSGEGIESVRFSCKNQELVFTDWTEKREEYGLVKNFTVPYGEDEEEYPYLTVEWEPAKTIRRLHEDCAFTDLPEELKEDLIVMEISFADGGRAVKAIRVSLLADGTFFAAFDDYEIGPSDSFVEREDALTLREQTQIRLSEWETERAENRERETECAENRERETERAENRERETEHVENRERETENMENRPQGEAGDKPEDGLGKEEAAQAARKAAEEYYDGTVFEVVRMGEKSVLETEAIFSVTVLKDGILQEPDRTIFLERQGEEWVVVNEGY